LSINYAVQVLHKLCGLNIMHGRTFWNDHVNFAFEVFSEQDGARLFSNKNTGSHFRCS